MNTAEFDALDRRFNINWADEIKDLTQNRIVTRYGVQVLQNERNNADHAWRTAYNKIIFARGNNLRTGDCLMLGLINDRLRDLNMVQEGINHLWRVAR